MQYAGLYRLHTIFLTQRKYFVTQQYYFCAFTLESTVQTRETLFDFLTDKSRKEESEPSFKYS